LKLSSEVKYEIRRKIIHGGLTGTLAPIIVLGIPDASIARALGIGLYSFFLSLFVLLEVSLKMNNKWNIPFASRAYRIMANEYELQNNTMLGGVFICLSGLLTVSFLDLHAALIGIMVLSFADSAASISGKAFPNHSLRYNRAKHVEGTFAFAVVSFAVTGFVFLFSSMSFSKLLALSSLIAVVTAIIESLPTKYYYDNLSVPLAAALFAQLFITF
jgi:dolichol kinase